MQVQNTLILTATGFTKIGNWTQFSINRSTTKPSIVQFSNSTSSILFSAKFDVNVAHQMVTEIIANIHLFNFAVLVLGFNKYIFKEVVVMLLHFFVTYIGQMGSIGRFGRVLRI